MLEMLRLFYILKDGTASKITTIIMDVVVMFLASVAFIEFVDTWLKVISGIVAIVMSYLTSLRILEEIRGKRLDNKIKEKSIEREDQEEYIRLKKIKKLEE
jgi:hypothetical protein